MIRRRFVFEERLNEAIEVPVKDKKSPSSEPQGSPLDAYVDAAIAAKWARHANAGNEARGFRPVRGQDAAPGKKVKFAAATLQGPALTWWNAKVATMGLETMNQMPWTEMEQLMTAEFYPIEEVQRMKHELWNLKVKEYNIVAHTPIFNELALMCPRMVEPKRVKVDAYIRGLTENIKGEVTSSKPANLNEAKRKWEKFQSGNSSGKSNQKDNSRQTSQNNQKQGDTRAMITTPTEKKVSFGSLPICKCCFTLHDGPCTIKCDKCGKVILGTDAQRRLSKRKLGGRAYAIKDAEPQGPNVVTGTFLLNNGYASILFDSGSDRSFVDTRFSSMLNIEPVKIIASYEVELADGRVVSTNTFLKGCTLNLVNHIFEIDLMPIELGTFDVIIDMDWLVKHDAIIIYGEKVVHIPYGNKTLTVESDKDVSRLKVISCIGRRARYHQLRIKEEAIPITTFRTWYGHFEFQVMSFGLTNAPDVFMDLMNGVCKPYLDKFVIVFMDDILVYSKDEEEHGKHLKIILELLKKERLYAKFLKCDFWLDSIQFFGHVIDHNGFHVDPVKIEAIKNWLHQRRQRSAPILVLPERTDDFVVYCDASLKGYGAVLMQREKVIVYASQELKVHE
ncbi:putative reverse transcriptase domain-containing protein [Tanacetum coccineum]